jgi:hypothetical protein
MKLTDALSNWLSIKKVHDNRPDDLAAKDTYDFFCVILKEDHNVEKIDVTEQGPFYIVNFEVNGMKHSERFFIDMIDALYEGIANEPRYN